MKLLAIVFLLLASLACSSQAALPAPAAATQEVHPLPAPATNRIGVVTDDAPAPWGLNVRDCAGTDCAIVGNLQPGDSVMILAEATVSGLACPVWYLVSWDRGSGWVCGEYVRITP